MKTTTDFMLLGVVGIIVTLLLATHGDPQALVGTLVSIGIFVVAYNLHRKQAEDGCTATGSAK